MFSEDIAIDLGTASIVVYIKGKGIVLQEPSVVAIDKKTSTILAVGSDARRMLGRTPDNIIAVRPLRNGVISDYEITEQMLKFFIKKASRRIGSMRKPRISVCMPSNVTEVEKRAVEDATKAAGAREVYLIEEPIAAAIGAGIDISKPRGSMIIDIGGGTTDVAVISLGACVVKSSVKVAGDDFDEAIIRFMRKRHNILIGERSAEELKINVGAAFRRAGDIRMEIRGRNLVSGLPRNISVGSDDMLEALKEPVSAIIDTVHSVLEKTPPELASDVIERGMIMTGGGSLLYGLDKLITHSTGINTAIAENATSCVAIGTGKYIEHMASNNKRR